MTIKCEVIPTELIEELDLLRPIYKKTATYGHFGRDEFPWEQINPQKIAKLQESDDM